MADDEKLPPNEDGEKNEDPFEQFINDNLPLDSVLKDGETVGDKKHSPSRDDDEELAFDSLDDDDDDFLKPSPPPPFGSRSGFTPRPNPFGGSPFGGQPPSSSSFGRPPDPRQSDPRFSAFGGQLPGSRPPQKGTTPPPSGGLFGSRTSNFSRFPPPVPPKNTWQDRLKSLLREEGNAEFLYGFMVLVVLLAIVLTLMYVDNLRLSIAVRDGQILELRHQLETLESRLNATEIAPEPITTP